MTFFNENKTLIVSHIDEDGWWVANQEEYVAKGTTLPPYCVEVVWEPQEGKSARWDADSGEWSIASSKRGAIYWLEDGVQCIVGNHSEDIPVDGVETPPPEYDPEVSTVLFKDGVWKIYPILIGTTYYGYEGEEFVISEYNFDIPEDHTLTPPPDIPEGHAIRYEDGEWKILVDLRGREAHTTTPPYESYTIVEVGPIPEGYTIKEYKPFTIWNALDGEWVHSEELFKPYKEQLERNWRNGELTKILDRIDQYEKDLNYDMDLRTSPWSPEDYRAGLMYRKVLSVYPDGDDFPYGERPTL